MPGQPGRRWPAGLTLIVTMRPPLTWLPYQQPEAVVNQIAAMRRPAMYAATQFVEGGGLVSYAQLMPAREAVTLFATALALVLDGVPAGEIPIERPKAFELAINVTAARELGIKIPNSMLKRADRVFPADLAPREP